jgi:hypothetical protein
MTALGAEHSMTARFVLSEKTLFAGMTTLMFCPLANGVLAVKDPTGSAESGTDVPTVGGDAPAETKNAVRAATKTKGPSPRSSFLIASSFFAK